MSIKVCLQYSIMILEVIPVIVVWGLVCIVAVISFVDKYLLARRRRQVRPS